MQRLVGSPHLIYVPAACRHFMEYKLLSKGAYNVRSAITRIFKTFTFTWRYSSLMKILEFNLAH